jgi:hypothetical protein
MTSSAYAREGRVEFKRLLLESLISSAAAEVESRRTRRQRLRARRAEHRLAELQRLDRALATGSTASFAWFRRPGAGYVAGTVWVVGALLLASEIVMNGVHTRLTAVGDVAMLVVSLVWFLVTVAQVPTIDKG